MNLSVLSVFERGKDVKRIAISTRYAVILYFSENGWREESLKSYWDINYEQIK